jgi:protein N-terminal amidase
LKESGFFSIKFNMRIGCLQFAPEVGEVEKNIRRANAILDKAYLDGLDILVLPEMAFSGKEFSI